MNTMFLPQVDNNNEQIDTMDVFRTLRDVAQASSVVASTANPWTMHRDGCRCTFCR